ncbi:MAG: response regulator [Kangiellaceae bacterium]|nr:response regulator [Kangiellaceae bacterium]
MAVQTMLIVDDSRLSRMLVKNFVQKVQPDWNFIEAQDGDDALKKCEGQPIDWMTIDYNMPGMDGVTLSIKLKLKFPDAHIALLTANIQDSVKNDAASIDIDFIQKPITEEKIHKYVGG